MLLRTIECLGIAGVVFLPVRAVGYVVQVPAGGQHGPQAHLGHLGKFLLIAPLPDLNHSVRLHLENTIIKSSIPEPQCQASPGKYNH